jgi:hypothetical protein
VPQYANTLSQPIKTPAGKQEMQWTTELLKSLMKTVPDWQAGSAPYTPALQRVETVAKVCNDFFRSSSSFLRPYLLTSTPLLIFLLLIFSFSSIYKLSCPVLSSCCPRKTPKLIYSHSLRTLGNPGVNREPE